MAQTQSFKFDFNGQKPDTLTLHGDAHFQKDTPKLCLTKIDKGRPVRHSFGQAVYAIPINFWDDSARADFETTVVFRIGTCDENPGKRFVFFMAPVDTIFPPTPSDPKPIFSVEFVTSANPAKNTEIDINIPYQNTVAKHDKTGKDLLDQDVTAVIQYDHAQKTITVTVTTPTTDSPYVLSYGYDLSTLLNKKVEVGLAAFTGDTVENPQVSKWDFTATLSPRAAEE